MGQVEIHVAFSYFSARTKRSQFHQPEGSRVFETLFGGDAVSTLYQVLLAFINKATKQDLFLLGHAWDAGRISCDKGISTVIKAALHCQPQRAFFIPNPGMHSLIIVSELADTY